MIYPVNNTTIKISRGKYVPKLIVVTYPNTDTLGISETLLYFKNTLISNTIII